MIVEELAPGPADTRVVYIGLRGVGAGPGMRADTCAAGLAAAAPRRRAHRQRLGDDVTTSFDALQTHSGRQAGNTARAAKVR